MDREFILPKPDMPWTIAVDAADPEADGMPVEGRLIVSAHSAVLLVTDNVII